MSAFRTMKETKNHKPEIIFISALFLVGIVLGLVLLLTRQTGNYVEVRVSGEVMERFSLAENVAYTITGADGGTNRLMIENGEAWLETADCPDALCVGMGKIRMVGQSVVCLPHEVVVEIVGETGETTDGVDLVAG